MLKLQTIIILIISLIIYLTIGLPILTNLVAINGILFTFPIYIFGLLIFAYLFGSLFGRGPKAAVGFLLVFILVDTLMAPIMLPYDKPPDNLYESQQLMADIYFYNVLKETNISYTAIWWTVYLIIPIICILLLMVEMRASTISSVIPRIL